MKICFGCFEQYDDSFDICPHCGYAEGTEPELATYMRPGAILKERYVIGRALGHGGFSVTRGTRCCCIRLQSRNICPASMLPAAPARAA